MEFQIGVTEVLSGGNILGLVWVIAELKTTAKYHAERIKRLESFVLKEK